ncbi:hypothetical protein C6502_22675 [Candidatus Poribacteria bacterium]|nr:MAG: hypothetical protein C6502_22675 [Candidatus Poribacteria bacterium]
MRFRRKEHTANNPLPTNRQPEVIDLYLQAHKYSIQFDISPEISYLNDSLPRLLPEFLPLFEGFPEGVWIAQQAVEEGLDFCQVTFWAFAEEPNAIKAFSIWFQAFFRDERFIDLLERFVKYALEDSDEIEVVLLDWARIHVTEEEVRQAVEEEPHSSRSTAV